jgi:hypothetical protein
MLREMIKKYMLIVQHNEYIASQECSRSRHRDVKMSDYRGRETIHIA